MKNHRGERLDKFLQDQGIKYQAVALKLNIGKNTPKNWTTYRDLHPDNIRAIAEHWPAIKDVFPEITFDDDTPFRVSEGDLTYNAADNTELRKMLRKCNDGYTKLMERYNRLLEEHVALQKLVIKKS